jgi:hypothetical protein
MVDEPESQHEKERIERLRRAMYSRSLSENMHPRERRELEGEHAIVGDDWRRPEPHQEPVRVAPVGIGFGKMLLYWLLGSAIVFFLGAAGFFAYYFSMGGGSLSASPQNINITVAGPPRVAGGEVTELQIAVTNRNKVPLELAELVVKFPSGTRSASDFKTDKTEKPLRQSLGTIAPGDVRQGTISAVFAGSAGSKASVKVELEYRVAGSNSIYVASTEYPLNFTSSPVSISVDGANEAISGQPSEIAVTIVSNSSMPLRDVLLSAQYPFGFKVNDAIPEASSPGFWALGDLGPGQKKVVTIYGVLTGETGDERVFHFTAGTRKDATKNSVDTALSQIAFHSSISQPFLKLNLAINEISGKTVTVSPGDKVNVAVNYQNNLTSVIENAVIVAKLSGIEFDGATVRSNDGFYRSTDGVMFWDKATTGGKLERLAPGDKGSVSFSFTMPSTADLQGTLNPRIEISVNAAGNRIAETGVPQVLQSTARGVVAAASDLTLIAEGLYYTNPYGSTGPIPPKANTETTYAIVFTLTNTTNAISGATLTAELPAYVRWLGRHSPPSENMTFNQRDGTVTWDIGEIAPGAGLNGAAPRQAAFAIGFTPSASQIGTQPVLLRSIVLKGTDASSTVPITRAIEDLTTNLSRVSKSSSEIIATGDPGFSSANATVVR